MAAFEAFVILSSHSALDPAIRGRLRYIHFCILACILETLMPAQIWYNVSSNQRLWTTRALTNFEIMSIGKRVVDSSYCRGNG